ncbi:BrnA antitoxin family protein [Rhodoferax sp. 4810]|uniref:BrnA antitoxin family protein n=1 Tax=Thiospirillum jenense TaxID=1653858 RepID=A0A839H6W1_9GAMM|nr:BrnA antitoxin family protein [Thiospirillum jenense]MBB1074713.1 BrnA antitoxin family protein [Rhodoferax jenense]MBB1125443.1 BrnA antitoxin family protein [Thiospirillum jenense]
MNAKENVTATDWIDPDDAPELTDDFFAQADEYIGNQLIRRGCTQTENTTQALTIAYDNDVIAAFKATGEGWEARMNMALRDWLNSHLLN